MVAERKTKSRKKKDLPSEEGKPLSHVFAMEQLKEVEAERDRLKKELKKCQEEAEGYRIEAKKCFAEDLAKNERLKQELADCVKSHQKQNAAIEKEPEGIPKIIEKLDRVVQELKGHTALDQSADILLLEEIKADLSKL